MELKPIRDDKAYESMLDWVDGQFNDKPELGSKAGDDLQIALLLIKAYEDEHYAIPLPDPIEAIKLKMDEKGLKSKDLVEWVGSKRMSFTKNSAFPHRCCFLEKEEGRKE